MRQFPRSVRTAFRLFGSAELLFDFRFNGKDIHGQTQRSAGHEHIRHVEDREIEKAEKQKIKINKVYDFPGHDAVDQVADPASQDHAQRNGQERMPLEVLHQHESDDAHRDQREDHQDPGIVLQQAEGRARVFGAVEPDKAWQKRNLLIQFHPGDHDRFGDLIQRDGSGQDGYRDPDHFRTASRHRGQR